MSRRSAAGRAGGARIAGEDAAAPRREDGAPDGASTSRRERDALEGASTSRRERAKEGASAWRGERGALEGIAVSREELDVGRMLCALSRRVRLLAAVTPVNLAVELARLSATWGAGRHEPARFVYAPPGDMGRLRRALDEVSGSYRGPRWALYAARADELGREAAACEAAGTDGFHERARARFPRRDAFDDDADRVAERWAEDGGEGARQGESNGAEAPRGPAREAGSRPGEVPSDDEHDPRSLVCAMRLAVGERRLAVRVEVVQRMAALAATGEGVIYVAAGRRLTAQDVARTVLHEVEGHALPSLRAKRAAVPLFELGTAFGSDDQEGRALLIEERAGLLSAGRRRELSWRHLAARATAAGATFTEVARLLLGRGAPLESTLRIAARVLRGGGADGGGLGREVAYLPALLRVRAALEEASGLEEILASGRVSVEAARILTISGASAASGAGGIERSRPTPAGELTARRDRPSRSGRERPPPGPRRRA